MKWWLGLIRPLMLLVIFLASIPWPVWSASWIPITKEMAKPPEIREWLSADSLTSLLAVSAVSNILVAVGVKGTVLRSIDAGEHWTTVETKTDARLVSMVALGDKTLVAVGES